MKERRRSRPPGAIRRRCACVLLSLGLLLAAPSLPAQAALNANLVAFLEAFDHAFRNHERDAAVALFYWRGVTDRDRARIMTLIDRDLALDLHGVRLIPPGDRPQRFEVEGILMRRNLPVVARLLARFAMGKAKHATPCTISGLMTTRSTSCSQRRRPVSERAGAPASKRRTAAPASCKGVRDQLPSFHRQARIHRPSTRLADPEAGVLRDACRHEDRGASRRGVPRRAGMA